MEFLKILKPAKAYLNIIKQLLAYISLIIIVYFFYMFEGLVLNYVSKQSQTSSLFSIFLIAFQVIIMFYFPIELFLKIFISKLKAEFISAFFYNET